MEWFSVDHAWRKLTLLILAPPPAYIAILPDDMMAVQELHYNWLQIARKRCREKMKGFTGQAVLRWDWPDDARASAE